MRRVLRRMVGMEETIQLQDRLIRTMQIELATRTRPNYRGIIHEVL